MSPKILAWDIEMTPLVTYEWSLWPKFISPEKLIKPQEMMSFAAKWVGQKGMTFRSTFHDGKDGMLEDVRELLHEADAVVSWNGKDFDTRHVNRELFEAGMAPPSPYKEIDLLAAARKRFKFASNKLSHVSTILGLAGKNKVDFDLWVRCMDEDPKAWATMKRYNKQDVVLLEQIYERMLPWIPNHPNVGLWSGDELDRCPACNSTDLTKQGHAYTQVGKFQRYVCNTCGKWSRSGKRVEGADIRAVTT